MNNVVKYKISENCLACMLCHVPCTKTNFKIHKKWIPPYKQKTKLKFTFCRFSAVVNCII